MVSVSPQLPQLHCGGPALSTTVLSSFLSGNQTHSPGRSSGRVFAE